MKYFSSIALLSSLLLSGCAVVSNIAPAGKDTWIVSGTSGVLSPAKYKTELYEKASVFCAGKNREFLPISSSDINVTAWTPGSSELVFRCLLENDPEFARPLMKPAPNVSVEITHK